KRIDEGDAIARQEDQFGPRYNEEEEVDTLTLREELQRLEEMFDFTKYQHT
ncbi:hypothetical protein KI387_028914, partial [Taxus chinensis]